MKSRLIVLRERGRRRIGGRNCKYISTYNDYGTDRGVGDGREEYYGKRGRDEKDKGKGKT